MIEHRYTDGAHWQDAAGYSRAVRSGSHIAVSGTTASAPDGSLAAGGPGVDRSEDTYRQALDALRRGVHAVEQLGGAAADVLRTRVYLVPGSDWQAAARAHREVFDAVRPANTMLFVAAWVGDDLLVEVEMDAEVGAGGGGSGHGGTVGDGSSAITPIEAADSTRARPDRADTEGIADPGTRDDSRHPDEPSAR
jgi:enamine deaminase RidA (YjgF/YER057c/UK114 family)